MKKYPILIGLKLTSDAAVAAKRQAEAEDRPMSYLLRRYVLEGLRRDRGVPQRPAARDDRG